MPKVSNFPVKEAVRLYRTHTITDLAAKYGCSRSYIHKQLILGGATMEPRSRGKKQRSDGLRHCWKCDQDLPLDQFGKNKAEIGGLTRLCKPCAAGQQHEQRMRTKFGISAEEYQERLEKQGGVCAICDRVGSNKEGDRLAVDHDHETGKVRGLLCAACNRGVGYFQDDPKLLKRAAAYLNI